MSQIPARNMSSPPPESPIQDPSNLTDSGVIVDVPQDSRPESSQENETKTDARGPFESERAEPRHCWICLQDEGDDSPEHSQWRSPCPCNLQAHEECLLEWITDIQAQPSGGTSLSRKVLCPQCKSEIKVERPIELIVAVTDLVSAIGQQLLFPTGAGMLLGCLYSGSMVYGFNAIELVFGGGEGRRMLFAARETPSLIRQILPGAVIDWFFTVLRMTDPFVPTSGGTWVFGVAPLIAPALLLSRTHIADRTFSMLPIMYLLFPQNHHIPHWPPSPGLALATLPYIRSAYNELYSSLFADLENGWNLAVQRRPREGETAEDVAHGQHARANEGNILDFEVEIINVEEGHGALNPQDVPPPHINLNLDAPEGQPQNIEIPLHNQPQAEEPQGEPQQAGAPQEGQPPPPLAGQPAPPNGVPAAGNEPWEFRQNISTAQVARSMIGALFFPAVSSLMGDLIFRTAPSTWVMKPVKKFSLQQQQATGLLQEKWGRSIVGGCLFVVLKDALTLYCKWRKAKHQGKRKVLDYDRSRNGNNGNNGKRQAAR
ncbi:hypothetical protein VC83_01129 [Pseudogymnoascus destructans]|uniref:RING-CH-type domain-containing protein n=2 Tax=Pseudogymnoascus destructans TaxID=655981 RepID=L8G4L8_PSED2|nr:uncharacterized protein VC83_01129 [Pseudogymnoascus destructans]ELR07764.1 hypothetical protein GMDG_00387 [Pseudogymnoascus destructans 20631-21]OAF62621.1 hypothetical protein VC83_01129 [Pseudogymnoascus destructans]